jgi:hypothetical protein
MSDGSFGAANKEKIAHVEAIDQKSAQFYSGRWRQTFGFRAAQREHDQWTWHARCDWHIRYSIFKVRRI